MQPAAAIMERLARLLLLVCTIVGVAALHTIGPAAVSDAHHDSRTAVTAGRVSAGVIPAVTGSQDDGCAGDGCTHPMTASSSAHDTSRFWEVCVAVVTALAISGLVAGLPWAVRALSPAIPLGVLRRRPFRVSRVGLVLATAAVIRT